MLIVYFLRTEIELGSESEAPLQGRFSWISWHIASKAESLFRPTASSYCLSPVFFPEHSVLVNKPGLLKSKYSQTPLYAHFRNRK